MDKYAIIKRGENYSIRQATDLTSCSVKNSKGFEYEAESLTIDTLAETIVDMYKQLERPIASDPDDISSYRGIKFVVSESSRPELSDILKMSERLNILWRLLDQADDLVACARKAFEDSRKSIK